MLWLPCASRDSSAIPQRRRVAVAECGTHAICDAEVGPCTQGERTLAALLLERLQPDQLLLADRGFYSLTLWRKASASGARLLWRVKSNLQLPVHELLADGSYTSEVFASTDRKRQHRLPVRVIEYALASVPGHPRRTDSSPRWIPN